MSSGFDKLPLGFTAPDFPSGMAERQQCKVELPPKPHALKGRSGRAAAGDVELITDSSRGIAGSQSANH